MGHCRIPMRYLGVSGFVPMDMNYYVGYISLDTMYGIFTEFVGKG